MNYNSCVEMTPSRLRLRPVAAGYAVAAILSSLLIYQRYLVYTRNPQEAAAAGGMYACGDLILELIVAGLFLLPTAALVWMIRRSEPAYTTYAKVLLGVSLTGPASLVLMVLPVLNQWYWGDACVFRLFAIPLIVVVLVVSRVLTNFVRARRLISYALMIEGLTVLLTIGGLIVSWKWRRG